MVYVLRASDPKKDRRTTPTVYDVYLAEYIELARIYAMKVVTPKQPIEVVSFYIRNGTVGMKEYGELERVFDRERGVWGYVWTNYSGARGTHGAQYKVNSDGTLGRKIGMLGGH